MNICYFTGHITADPEMRYLENGTQFCKFTLAVKRPHSKATDFLYFTAWNNDADFLCAYGQKGDKLGIVGNAVVEKWEVNGEKRSRNSYKVTEIEIYTKHEPKQTTESTTESYSYAELKEDDDDLPF